MKTEYQVNIYDFDKTLFPYDSGTLFWLFCIRRNPLLLLLLPLQLRRGFALLTEKCSVTEFKNSFFVFIRFIDIDKSVRDFWDKYEHLIRSYYLSDSLPNVVISASPDFLLEEISRRVGFDYLICTRHERRTGHVLGVNCRREEKVRRFHAELPGAQAVEVFSDSLKQDTPIFRLGKKCHLVTPMGIKDITVD